MSVSANFNRKGSLAAYQNLSIKKQQKHMYVTLTVNYLINVTITGKNIIYNTYVHI